MCEWAQQHYSSFWVIEFHCRCMVRETLETTNERTNTKKHSLCLDLARLKFLRNLSMYSMFKRLQSAEVFEPVSSQSAVTYNHLSTLPPRQVFILLVRSFQILPLPWETLCCHGPRSRVSWWWCRWAPSRLHPNRLRGTAWWARSSATATSLHAWWTRHRSSRTPFKYSRPGTHADSFSLYAKFTKNILFTIISMHVIIKSSNLTR